MSFITSITVAKLKSQPVQTDPDCGDPGGSGVSVVKSRGARVLGNTIRFSERA